VFFLKAFFGTFKRLSDDFKNVLRTYLSTYTALTSAVWYVVGVIVVACRTTWCTPSRKGCPLFFKQVDLCRAGFLDFDNRSLAFIVLFFDFKNTTLAELHSTAVF